MGGNETIKTLPAYDRPYEKLERYGANSLTDSELLAVIIRSGTKNRNCLEVSRKLIGLFDGSLADVFAGGLNELTRCDGIGRTKAIQLKAVYEICQRLNKAGFRKVETAANPDDVGRMLIGEIGFLPHEVFHVLFLDKKNHIIGGKTVSVGILDKAIVHPREVFEPAIRELAYAVILAHNHPGGDVNPSNDDLSLTKRIIEAGKIVGIEVLDHIIVSKSDFFSMAYKKVGGFSF